MSFCAASGNSKARKSHCATNHQGCSRQPTWGLLCSGFRVMEWIFGKVAEMSSRGMSAVDVHVGRRVHTARLAKGLSQSALGSALGLTFQQIQKYENGTNRISTGRLHEIAELLEVPLAYFFEGLEKVSKIPGPNVEMAAITTALSTPREFGLPLRYPLSKIQHCDDVSPIYLKRLSPIKIFQAGDQEPDQGCARAPAIDSPIRCSERREVQMGDIALTAVRSKIRDL